MRNILSFAIRPLPFRRGPKLTLVIALLTSTLLSSTRASSSFLYRQQTAAASESKRNDQTLSKGYQLAQKGRWREAKKILGPLVTSSVADTRSFASMVLFEVCLRLGDFREADRMSRVFSRSNHRKQSPMERFFYRDMLVRADLFRRYRPHQAFPAANNPPEALLKLNAALREQDLASVERISWSLLRNSLLFDGADAECHWKAIMGLFVKNARGGNRLRATGLSQEFKSLLNALPSNAGLAFSADMDRQDMDDISRHLAKSDPKTGPKAFRPGPDPFWPAATSAAARQEIGLPSQACQAVDDYIRLCRETGADSSLVIWRGKIVGEWYSERNQGRPINCNSSTKSIAGLLADILRGDGKITFEDPVSKYFHDWQEGLRGKVTLYELLTMRSGISHLFDMEDKIGDTILPDLNGYVLQTMRPDEEPGQAWHYANYGVQLLSPILEKAAGEPLHQFARDRIFTPLGIPTESGLVTDPKGSAILFAGAPFRAREFARLGALVLNNGKWAGKQVLPGDILDSLRQAGRSRDDHYSMLWWYEQSPESISMLGSLNNDCVVYPASDLVVVRQQKWYWTMSKRDYYLRSPQALKRLALSLEKAGDVSTRN